MASRDTAIDVDEDDELSILGTDNVPTLDGNENKIIALIRAQDDVSFDLAWHELPHDHRVKIGNVQYALVEPYRNKKQRQTAWWWSQGIELLHATKGKVALYLTYLLIAN
jgi:hypothetical protein